MDEELIYSRITEESRYEGCVYWFNGKGSGVGTQGVALES